MPLPLRIRADLHVNSSARKLILAAVDNEKPEHLAIKLAAYILFWDSDLTVDASSKHPALSGTEFRPDLLGTDVTGAVSFWVECGNTSRNKILKTLRRHPDARVAVFKENPAQARRLRAEMDEEDQDTSRLEIYCWPERVFPQWSGLLAEKTEVYGEAGGVGMNLVVNEQVYVADFLKI